MSALSTPGGGSTTAQNKPTSGKQKYQKLDINSLYCVNRNESSEPSSVKSQLSRKHGMQSLGKVPSARRPPANLPSLKTETGQDPNTNSVSVAATTVTTPPTCTSQTVCTTSSSNAGAANCGGGWVALPPPSSPHFRTEFPSLEAAAQPSHRASEHSTPQPQLRPQTEGSWTCGGGAGARDAASPAAPAPAPALQQTPALRAILPPFLMKAAGSAGGGLALGVGGPGAGAAPRERSGAPAPQPPRAPHRPAPPPRAVEVLTARPILRDDQISSLDDMSRDAGWAQNDDIDYDQKLDFSDGESSVPNRGGGKISGRLPAETERSEAKLQEPGDEDRLWAERRQKQNNEVAQAVARARQRKEEEQRRQQRDAPPARDARDRTERVDRDRNDNRDREHEARDKDRVDNRDRERTEGRDRDRVDNRDKERSDPRERGDIRDKERGENRDRDRNDNRYENRDRERDMRDSDRDRPDNRGRVDNRDRPDSDKERNDGRDRDRNDNREQRMDRDRFDRDRQDRERERPDRERSDRDRERNDRDRDRNDRDRERNDRDRERDRDYRESRDYGREREQNNPGFSKTFQENIPPRFLKLQQNRQQDDHKPWAFSGKPAPRRQEPSSYNAPRHAPHNGRRSYSRDYSDREDDFRREKEGPGPQWRSEMQDYDRSGRDLDRSNSKDSYRDTEFKDKRPESDRKPIESSAETSGRSAADKLTEVFERKSIGAVETVSTSDSPNQMQLPERKNTPPSNVTTQRESSEKELTKTSWAEVAEEEPSNYVLNSPIEKGAQKEVSNKKDASEPENEEAKRNVQQSPNVQQTIVQQTPVTLSNLTNSPQIPQQKFNNHTHNVQNTGQNQNTSHSPFTIQSQCVPSTTPNAFHDNQSVSKSIAPSFIKTNPLESSQTSLPTQKPQPPEPQQNVIKPIFASQKSEKDLSESESIASKSSTEPSNAIGIKTNETHSIESLHGNTELQKRTVDDKKPEKYSNEQLNKIPGKEPIERKSSGSGSEKKIRGGYGGGYAVYNRGWGPRESRGRRSHRSSRSNNRASESDGSTDGAAAGERKDRRRAPRSPRGPKKPDRSDDTPRPASMDPAPAPHDSGENREPFAPRGQPSRRGRGGFQGTSRPPAPAKRVTGYGPPNTKSPFGQVNRAVKENDETKENVQIDDKAKGNNKPRAGSSGGRGRDRRPKGPAGPLSGEDENWETTSEHSEGGGTGGRRRSAPGGQSGAPSRGPPGRNSAHRQSGRNPQAGKGPGDGKPTDITEAMTDLKINTVKKDDEIVDDGFQEVRNKKNSKDARPKEEIQTTGKQPRSGSNQGGGRNGSSSRNPNDKSNARNSAPVAAKTGPQYERPRQANLAPRFVKQRQKQQLGLVNNFGPDTGAAPPPPPVNAWDKPISQSLRANVEELVEPVDAKSTQSSQRSTPADAPAEVKPVATPCVVPTEKAGVLDGTTPPVETIIFENTNYKTTPPEEVLQQKYQMGATTISKPQAEEISPEMEPPHPLTFNGDVRARPRSIQELIADNGRTGNDGDVSLGLQMSFDTAQKSEDSSDMKLDFAFGSDLGQLTEEKGAKALVLPRGVHMSTSSTISPLAADLNLKIASVKKVWEMPAVAEGGEELQFAGFEEGGAEAGAPPNVCKVKPTQQLQSPPPQHYSHVGYAGGYGGLSVSSPPAAVLFNSSQQLLGSSQQLPQQGGLYGAFLEQSRGQFGGFPPTPYGAGSAAPYNYQPPPDMFQSLPNQYRMAAAAGGGAAFGQTGQMANSPSTVLISSTSNSLMSATVKPSSQQIGAIGSKGGGVGGVSTYQQQYLGYTAQVGEAPYSLPGLLPRPAPPATSYYSPYQPPTAPAPTYPLQFTQPAQSAAFGSQFLSSPLQVAAAAAVQQMQQQYRGPMQQQYAAPQPRPPPQQQLKSPLHEHANGFSPLCEAASPTPKGAAKPQKPPHSPPQHKYHAPPPHPPPAHTPHQHHQQQPMSGGNNGRCGGGAGGGGGAMGRGGMGAPRYPAPIQRPPAPAMPMYRAPPAGPQAPPQPRPGGAHAQLRPNLYYHHHQRNGGGGGVGVGVGVGGDRTADAGDAATGGEQGADAPAPADADAKPE